MTIRIQGIVLIFCLVTYLHASEEYSFKPEGGFVPNAATASNIAQAVLAAIYGSQKIDRELPLVAVLKDGIWTVSGTLQPGLIGGVATIEIAKDDARILRVSHGK